MVTTLKPLLNAVSCDNYHQWDDFCMRRAVRVKNDLTGNWFLGYFSIDMKKSI